MLVFLLASIACWALSSVIDWAFPGQAIHLMGALRAGASR